MVDRLRNTAFALLLYLAFFASGASSLVAEVTWNRMLIVVVGNSLSATALILVVFMGGLGLGSYLGGRYFSGRRVSLLPYVGLELCIGIYVLLSPTIFAWLTELFSTLAVGNADRAALTFARVIVSMLALLLPATLMGATFPAIINGAALDDPGRRTARTGYLYSTNTLGAAIGCFAAGYHLLFEFGVQISLNVAFVSYLVAAGCALFAHRLQERPRSASQAAVPAGRVGEVGVAPSPAVPVPPGRRAFLYFAVTAVGFVALAYEVLLTRISILYLGNAVSVFALVLTAFLLGTGASAIAGTWLYGKVGKRGADADRIFGWSALVAALLVCVTPYLLLTDLGLSVDEFARFADSGPRNPLAVLGILILPTVFIGGLLPLAIRMLHPEKRGTATREAATLYAVNTAGGLIGAGTINHILVPVIGVQGALAVLVAILAGIGLANLTGAALHPRRWVPAGAGAVGLAAFVLLVLPNTASLYAGKLALSTRADAAEPLHVREGRAATVVVLDQDDPALGTYRDMYLNGVEEASTRYWHVQLFKLLGVLPPLLHESDDPKDAMVIAFGAGITAGSVLASNEVASLDVVDLNPDIEGINDLFTEVNGDVFHRDEFYFHEDDGRNYLVTCNKQYDLIIGDSTHPRAYDSWILYTQDFYEDVRDRLAPGGIFAQWVPVLGSMRGQLMRIHLNTFRSVFPNTTIWYVYGSDQAFLLATPEPLVIDSARLQAKLDALPGWFRAQEYWLDTVARVAGFFWMDPRSMELMIAGEERVNTDDVHYFDKQSAVYPLPPQFQLPAFQTSALPYVRGLDTEETAVLQGEQRLAGHLASYSFYGSEPDLHRAFCIDPENGGARWFMGKAFRQQIPEPGSFCAQLEVREFEALVAHEPGNPNHLNGLAEALQEAGRLDEALQVVSRALDLAPDSGPILDTYGWILFRQEKYGEAIEALEGALAMLPDHPIVLYHLGAARDAAGDDEVARQHLKRALEVAPDHEQAAEVRRLLEELTAGSG